MKPDFSGYATRYNVRCDDGLIIEHGAFSDCHMKQVPIVYNHRHGSIKDVLGKATLYETSDGVRADCYLNNTEAGCTAREVLQHGDLGSLSIFANQLVKRGQILTKGNIRELSLVLDGCNPGAKIDDVSGLVVHGILTDDEECYYIDCNEAIAIGDAIAHAAEESKSDPNDSNKAEEKKDDTNVKTNQERVFESLNDEQKDLLYTMVGIAVDAAKNGDLDDEDETDDKNTESKEEAMKHSVFDKEGKEASTGATYTAADEAICISDIETHGSLRKSCVAHGITNIEYNFPEATLLDRTPGLVARNMGWVDYVMSKVHRTPFANIKSLFADITGDDARAMGYTKGNLKKEEVFTMLKRTTSPTTVYKKQKIDRDDMVDVRDFDMVGFIKSEMRLMLNEELARAFLIGDGRLASSDDKIKEANIRPIAREEALYTITASVTGTNDDEIAKNFIRQVILSRKDYKGSGSPDLFCTEETLTKMLLLTDNNGRDLYPDEATLARKLRVNSIITVSVMEGAKDAAGNSIMGIVVNLKDYNVGADRGGAINMFDDFDIDYNQYKYLIETRCSGALVVPYSAIVITSPATAQSTRSAAKSE